MTRRVFRARRRFFEPLLGRIVVHYPQSSSVPSGALRLNRCGCADDAVRHAEPRKRRRLLAPGGPRAARRVQSAAPRARARPRPYAERLGALAAAVHVSPPRAAAAVAAATASMASGGSRVAPELTPDVAVNF